MLSLDSERWQSLTHAYGSAKGIPALLRQLDSAPPPRSRSDCPEPWWSLWGALCHQATVYPASYAATPYIAQAGTRAPLAERWQHVHLVGYIEVCRVYGGPAIPPDLEQAYWDALALLPRVVCDCVAIAWDRMQGRIFSAGLLAAKGQHQLSRELFDTQELDCPECGCQIPSPLADDA